MGKNKKKGDKSADTGQSSQQPQQSQQNPNQQQNPRQQQSQSQQPRKDNRNKNDWQCLKCGFNNFANKTACHKCSEPKGQEQSGQAAQPSKSDAGSSQQQSKEQKPKEVAQKQQPEAGKQPEKDKRFKKDWKCSNCGKTNMAKIAACKGCSAPRPAIEETVQPTPSTSQQSREQTPVQKQQLQPSTSDASLPDVQSLKISPVKQSSGFIESSPDGRVYEGKRGRKCQVEVNYATINFVNLPKACYHYDVSFKPETPKKMLPAALEEFMRKFFGKYVYGFDGRKNMFTAKKLSIKENEIQEFSEKVTANLKDRSREFEIKVQFTSVVDMGVLLKYKEAQYQNEDKPAKAIQALDIILRSAFRKNIENNSAIQAGRAVYFVPNARADLGDGMELWYGLFQSAILGRAKIYLNVDVLHKAFPSSVHLLEYLRDSKTKKIPYSLDQRQKENLREFLQMLTIGYRLSPNDPLKTYGFNGLGNEASRALFECNGQQISVKTYYEREKKIKLNFPDLPVLWVGSKNKRVYFPIEFCELPPGQATNKKCTPLCTRNLIKYSATSTDERKKKIRELLNKISYDMDPTIKGFGINIDKSFQRTDARVIDPPSLKYSNSLVKPSKGVWREENFIEVRQDKIKWCICNLDGKTSMPTLKNFKDDMINEAEKQRIFFEDMQAHEIINFNLRGRENLEDVFRKKQSEGYQLIVAIINDFDNAYARVKQAAELKVGILTQCIKGKTLSRMNASTLKNILLKLNAKLNGRNHEIQEVSYQTINSSNSGVMFVGADVTHPSPDQQATPSVVGVASSYDQVGFKYCCAWRLQDPKMEMIGDLENIIAEHLHFYGRTNGKLPTKILYYRDGVSDGQFKEVLQREMTAIRNALKRIYGTNKHAEVTFIVVQKRHHTRFFPTDKNFSDGRNNNILPGTVVDKDIVHPFQYQFFLASHAAIQGVAKPTKYCILVNESNIQPDDLQAITYDLCHLFTRCSRSVSYPAPTYYAHLVAARGKNYTIGRELDMRNLQGEYDRSQIRPDFIQNSPMFFV